MMVSTKLQLDERDRAKYGLPEWLPFDLAALDDLPYSVSGAWEAELKAATGKGISELLRHDLARDWDTGKLALVWLAMKVAGIEKTPAFKDLDIRCRLVREPKADDAVPPPDGSSKSPSESEPSPTA